MVVRSGSFVRAVPMKIVTIQPNKTASKRTKERIKAHGPEFEILEETAQVLCLQGVTGVLVKSKKTSWEGWLVLADIILIDSVLESDDTFESNGNSFGDF